MTIRPLMVDHDAPIRVDLKMLLKSDDDLDVVCEAANGAEALSRVAHLNPDVILMNIQMPEMDGIEAVRRIGGRSADDEGPRVQLLTACAQDEYVRGRYRQAPVASC